LAATTTADAYTPSASALKGGTTYYWQVQALAPSGAQNGTWSYQFDHQPRIERDIHSDLDAD
jgi:hypothetical protein